jgi:hypothetical protein
VGKRPDLLAKQGDSPVFTAGPGTKPEDAGVPVPHAVDPLSAVAAAMSAGRFDLAEALLAEIRAARLAEDNVVSLARRKAR